jgi:hypothetical protein
MNEAVLGRRQIDEGAPAPHLVASGVETERAELEQGGARLRRSSAQDRGHPEHEFIDGEGFGEVVVTPGSEATDTILGLGESREEEDGRCRTGGAQTPAHFESIDAGQHDIKHNEIRRAYERRREGSVAGGDVRNRVPLEVQSRRDDIANGLAILGDEDAMDGGVRSVRHGLNLAIKTGSMLRRIPQRHHSKASDPVTMNNIPGRVLRHNRFPLLVGSDASHRRILMKTSLRAVLVPLTCLVLLASACASSQTASESTSSATESTSAIEIAALFADGALTEEAIIVDCTLENGSETTCYQFEVASLSTAVNTEGPFCPVTTTDTGGIWVWDGDESGLYALDEDFWALMEAQGYEFADQDGDITIVDPAGGPPDSSGTKNSCLQATPNGDYHLQVLIPTTPEMLDEVTDLSTISQVGLALDGVTIFGDAPSVLDTGGLPALDSCGGHIDPSGYYHWHFGAESIQSNLDAAGAVVTCDIEQDNEAAIAFAYDGYLIYGPEEDGVVPTDLDECGGHVSETSELGETYHYHFSTDSPNLPSCRVGAIAVGNLTSPDGENIALPNGSAGGTGGPPAGEAPNGGPPADGEPAREN